MIINNWVTIEHLIMTNIIYHIKRIFIRSYLLFLLKSFNLTNEGSDSLSAINLIASCDEVCVNHVHTASFSISTADVKPNLTDITLWKAYIIKVQNKYGSIVEVCFIFTFDTAEGMEIRL